MAVHCWPDWVIALGPPPHRTGTTPPRPARLAGWLPCCLQMVPARQSKTYMGALQVEAGGNTVRVELVETGGSSSGGGSAGGSSAGSFASQPTFRLAATANDRPMSPGASRQLGASNTTVSWPKSGPKENLVVWVTTREWAGRGGARACG